MFNYVSIEVEVELMLFDRDGLQWISDTVNQQTSTAFRHMCEFAVFLNHPQATNALDTIYGKGVWKALYDQELRRGGHQFSTHQSVIDAGSRKLKVYPDAWK